MALGDQSLPEYDAIRRRVQSQYSQRRSEAGDTMKRRFATQGMLGAGAYQKMAAQQEQDLGREEQETLGQVDFVQAQELQRRKEIEDTRNFAKSEREASQLFSKGERESSQLFNRELFDKDMSFKEKLHASDQKWKEIENSWRAKEHDQNTMNNYVTAYLGLADSDLSDEERDAILEKLGAYLPAGQVPNARFGGKSRITTGGTIKAGLGGMFGGGWLW